jgi:hypothetical protein
MTDIKIELLFLEFGMMIGIALFQFLEMFEIENFSIFILLALVLITAAYYLIKGEGK